MKTEPDVFSFGDLQALGTQGTFWEGVRNYQARNFMREMRVGDQVLIYHSSTKSPAIVGLARVIQESQTDLSQFDVNSPYFDAKASPEKPRWEGVMVQATQALKSPVSLQDLRAWPGIEDFILLRKGNRLSVMPVTAKVLEIVLKHAMMAGDE
ncbi:MAG: EVE domain-containing protein [Deinococcales bacterium]